MEIITSYLADYFSDSYHVIFWLLILVAVCFEFIKKKIRNSSKIKKWMRKHNIGRKY